MVLINVVWVDIDIQTAPPVIPPEITSAERTNDSDAVVTFNPQSIGTFDIDYYIANDTTMVFLVN